MKKKTHHSLLALIILIVLLIIACLIYTGKKNLHEDKPIRDAAKNEVDKLQILYNDKRFADIYNRTCEDFKKATEKDSFLFVMERKSNVLGEFKNHKLHYINVINSHYVTLHYRVNYTHYSLLEKFDYIQSKDKKLCLKAMYTDDSGDYGEVVKLD